MPSGIWIEPVLLTLVVALIVLGVFGVTAALSVLAAALVGWAVAVVGAETIAGGMMVFCLVAGFFGILIRIGGALFH